MLGSGARLTADETARAFILLGALGLAALVARAAADPANDQGRQKEPYHFHPLPFVELEQNVPKSYRGTIYAGLAPGVKREVGASGQARGRAHETAVWAPLDSRPSTARARRRGRAVARSTLHPVSRGSMTGRHAALPWARLVTISPLRFVPVGLTRFGMLVKRAHPHAAPSRAFQVTSRHQPTGGPSYRRAHALRRPALSSMTVRRGRPRRFPACVRG